MGTYTTNYQLFMPTVGEQGWGDLVNGNFTTIDTTMSGLNTRIGTLETEMDAVEERVTILESGDFETVTAENVYGNLYGNLYGKRIGELTLTQPNKWNFNIGATYIKSQALVISYQSNGSLNTSTGTVSVTDSEFYHMNCWDELENSDLECTYTLEAIPYRYDETYKRYHARDVTLTITNFIDGSTTVHNFVINSVDDKPTFTAPALISSVKFYMKANATAASRQNVYVKPHGT